ncbi:MAG: hypothetical protein JWO36_189 [Myxococcales bacterium]|nr:hypothetical protein [Myxococcales bacterium]
MIRRITLFAIITAAFATVGCKKKEGVADQSSKTAEVPKEGCGTDYADPAKQFCVKLPPGYALETSHKDDSGTTFEFKGPEMRFDVLVWSNPTFTYDYQLGIYGDAMKKPDHTDVESGGTPGQTQWWAYKFGTDTKLITALAKSSAGMAMQCESNGSPVPPEIMDACKTLRPYPAAK